MASKTISLNDLSLEKNYFPDFWFELNKVIWSYYGTHILLHFYNTEKWSIDNRHFSFSFIVEDIKTASLMASIGQLNKEIKYFNMAIDDTSFVIITIFYNTTKPKRISNKTSLKLFKQQCSHKPYLNDSKYGPHREWLAKVDQVIKKYDTK